MFMLRIFGEKPFYLNMKELDSRFSEDEMNQVYPELSWQCKSENTTFGDRYCISKIGSFNDLPADRVVLFFRNHAINAIQVNYRHNFHATLGKDLRYQLGNPQPEAETAKSVLNANKVVHWRTKGGHVITKQTLNKGEEPALLWLSPAQMADQGHLNE
jgi:hypothetical protein